MATIKTIGFHGLENNVIFFMSHLPNVASKQQTINLMLQKIQKTWYIKNN